MSKKILVLGSTGLIGHQVYNYLRTFKDLILFNLAYRKKLTEDTILMDMRDEKQLDRLIEEMVPDYIINCVGILIEGSEKNPENAIFLNAYMPHHLMRLADKVNARLIHISTDCVYSGKKGQYNEMDEKDGTSTYARTKALGEIINDRHLTLRTSVVGPELKTDGEELFNWFMHQSGNIQGYTKSLWSGVTTYELAKAVKRALDAGTTGLYHVTNGTTINKYQLLNLFKKYSEHFINIEPVDGVNSDKSFVDHRHEFDYEIPSYEIMISDMFDLMKGNAHLYQQYLN